MNNKEKRFYYNWKTGRMKDTQSNSQATSNMRILERLINDACDSYEKKINEQDMEIKDLKCRINSIYAILKEEKCGDVK